MAHCKPCDNCPFRSDRPFRGLRTTRAEEIVRSLHQDGSFNCHKTIDYSNDLQGRVTRDSKLCVGAAKFLENTRPGGMRANLMFRLAIACGQLPDEFADDVPVYESIEAFLEGAVF